MKILSFLPLFFVFSSAAALEKIEHMRVDKVVCGEIDPYVLGDTCLVFGSSQKAAYGFAFDSDLYTDANLQSLKRGDFFHANLENASKVFDPAANALINKAGKDLNTSLSNYMVEDPKNFFMSIVAGKVENDLFLRCQTEGQFDGFYMWSNVLFESKLRESLFGTYELVSPLLKYELSMDNFSTLWDSFHELDPEYSLLNRRHYRPAKHHGHIKFNDIYSSKTYGDVDLLLPKKELDKGASGGKFEAFAIMTHISDHWGGTVKLSCQLL